MCFYFLSKSHSFNFCLPRLSALPGKRKDTREDYQLQGESPHWFPSNSREEEPTWISFIASVRQRISKASLSGEKEIIFLGAGPLINQGLPGVDWIKKVYPGACASSRQLGWTSLPLETARRSRQRGTNPERPKGRLKAETHRRRWNYGRETSSGIHPAAGGSLLTVLWTSSLFLSKIFGDLEIIEESMKSQILVGHIFFWQLKFSSGGSNILVCVLLVCILCSNRAS